jgi:hypothetical protein
MLIHAPAPHISCCHTNSTSRFISSCLNAERVVPTRIMLPRSRQHLSSRLLLHANPLRTSFVEAAPAPTDAPEAPNSSVRPPGLAAAAPAAEPCTPQQLDRLVDFLSSCKHVVALTGAGISTESNIPDYRGPNGAYTTGFSPMTHQQVAALQLPMRDMCVRASVILTCFTRPTH